jgi:hypothetical protein
MTKLCIASLAIILGVSCAPTEALPPPPGFAVNACKNLPPPPPPSIKDDPACKLFSWPLSPQAATEILKRTRMFTQTGIYYSGEPPPQIAAFNVLLDQADPVSFFDDIAHDGGAAGRLYALAAFDLLDRHRRDALVATLQAEQGVVFTQFGCSGMDEAVRDVVDVVLEQSYGTYFREAKGRTYSYFTRPANICMQATVGGAPIVDPR